MKNIIHPGFLLTASFGTLLSVTLPHRAIAQPPDLICYFQTSEGRTVDLSHLCNQKQSTQPRSNPVGLNDNTSPLPPNPNFSPAANATPGDPFGNGPEPSQCYIVDADGNPCE
jgi:hypothetical protein